MLIELALALAPTLHGEEVLLGPPAVCHPFDIGDAHSLPWKAGAFGFDPEFPLDKLNPELVALLDHQEGTLVQLESIRRAVVYAVGFGRTEKLSLVERQLHTESLLSMLRGRVLATYLDADGEPDQERLARAWFQLGYALAAVDQLDWNHDLGVRFGDGAKELRNAMQWEGVDAAMCLGAALGVWTSPDGEHEKDVLFLRAVRMAGPDGGLVTKNLITFAARFYDQHDYASILQHLEKRVAAS